MRSDQHRRLSSVPWLLEVANRRHESRTHAFTLIELLIVIGIIVSLSALLLPTLSRAKAGAKRSTCSNNLRQINLGIRMYAEDQKGTLPVLPTPNPYQGGVRWFYKELIKGYLDVKQQSSPNDRPFICPADTFIVRPSDVPAPGNDSLRLALKCHDDPRSDYSSYEFNGFTPEYMEGFHYLGGVMMDSIQEPTKTVFVAEAGTYLAFSWHNPGSPIQESGARCLISFADGHSGYLPIYWNGQPGSQNQPIAANPASPYEYKWTAN
jgi:prepilin-type N-terminal cleavage/methylation domain-containing protein